MKFGKGGSRLASCALAALTAGMFAGASGAARGQSSSPPYEINVVLPLTGPGAFLGTGEQQSLQLVQKTVNASGGINGRPLSFIYHDDQSSPQLGVQLTSGVVSRKPAVILGSSLVAICRAMAPLAKNGPVDYCFSPGLHPSAGAYAFTASVSTTDLAKVILRYFRMKGWTRLGFMFSTDATGQEFEQGIDAILKEPQNTSFKVVAAEHFNPTDTSVSAQMQKIKQANPQAVIAWSTGSPIATIFRAMIDAGVDVPLATTDGNMTYAQMRQYAKFLPKELYIPAGEFIVRSDPKAPESAQKAHEVFYRAFDSIHVKPDEPSELAWEPAMILVHALRTLGPSANATQIRDFLVKLKGYAGVDGVYDFVKTPQRGLSENNAVVTRWNASEKLFQVVSEAGGQPLQP